MNDTLCPFCNFLLYQRRLAFIKREYSELARYEKEYETHRAQCDIVNGNWYKGLWDKINAPRGYGWEVNPFVWVIEFKNGEQASLRASREERAG